MYKFMFVALLGSAIYPDWPVQAVYKGQAVIESLQDSNKQVLTMNSPD